MSICKWFKKKKKPIKTPTKKPSPLYQAASTYIGTREIPGAKHNKKIQEMHKVVTGQELSDETPWCAAFVNFILHANGYKGTGSLLARSFLKYGQLVDAENVRQGDIVLLWRESPNSWKGHVGFFHDRDSEYVYILGGNQANAVNISKYKRTRILAYRRV